MRGLRVATIAGIPVELHYSLPLGILFFGGMHFRPYFWSLSLFIILFHELGHAAVVRSHRLRVTRIVIHGLGGLCYWRGEATPIGRAKIAWGGVLAQLVLLVPAYAVLLFDPHAFSSVSPDVEHALIRWNAFMIVFNLVPVAPLDGAEAWPLFKLLLARRRARERKQIAKRTEEMKALMRKLDAVEEQPVPTEIEGVVSDLFDRVKKKG